MSKFGNCLICPREILMGGKVFSIKKFLPLCSLPSSTYILTYVRTYVVVHRPIASSCWSDWSAVAAGRQHSCENKRGEARGFKATGLACLAHQSPGIKCEQSCSSSPPHPCLLSFSYHQKLAQGFLAFGAVNHSFAYRTMTQRVANSKVNYVFAASLVKKFELVKCCCRHYTSPPLIYYHASVDKPGMQSRQRPPNLTIVRW